MMTTEPISFQTALHTTLNAVPHLDSECIPLEMLTDRILSEDVYALVDSPSLDASLKDGYAIRSEDILGASPALPVALHLVGHTHAGCTENLSVEPGTAVRILTGAPIPAHATAVLAEEFTSERENSVIVYGTAKPGRNILRQGTDVHKGGKILTAGERIHPAAAGLLASAGHSHARVIRNPQISLLATGDEVIAPGKPLQPGKLFASNLTTLSAWCTRYAFHTAVDILPDDPSIIKKAISESIQNYDAVFTSGGAWNSERDLVVGTLNDLGWDQKYHRIRLGPGKGVAFGLLQNKPVFCLPGGPPSNLMAFLQLALPALQRMAGYPDPGLPVIDAVLSEDVSVQEEWTQCVFGLLEPAGDNLPARFTPLPRKSRLQMMASASAVLLIPEGVGFIAGGNTVKVQILI